VTSVGRDVGADLAALRSTVDKLPAELAQVAADVGAPAILEGARAARGTLTMSNNPRLNGELGCTAIPRATEVEFVATPMGPWFLAEFGGSPPDRGGPAGQIRPKRKYGKRKRAAALSTPHGPRARVNDHPGASPRPGWRAGVQAAEPVIVDAVEAHVAARLSEA